MKLFSLLFALVLLGATLSIAPRSAQAQTIFCPPNVTEPGGTNNPGIRLRNGACTNPLQPNGTEVGAFSGAALAGQAVGNLAQSMSIVQTAATTRQIEERRNTESKICPAGESFIDGQCRVPPPAATPPQAAPTAGPGVTPRPAVSSSRSKIARRATTAEPTVPSRRVAAGRRRAPLRDARVAPAPAYPVSPVINPIIPSHFGAWAEGYGDYEERSGRGIGQIQCCTGVAPIPLQLDASSRTSTAGFLGGIDWTTRNLYQGGDGLILGLTTGYLDSEVKVKTSSVSTVPPAPGNIGVNNGFANLRAHLSGPSVGLYATYFNGPWANDFLIKNDFLSLNESFTELQAYQTCTCFPAFTSSFSGKGNTSLDQFTVSDNVNYRIPFLAQLWVEPTFGVQYTRSSYSGSAAALGLADGDLVRVQGGARLGGTTLLGDVAMTTSLTGLAYDDVLVSGDFIQGGVFGTSGRILNDEGKVRGEGILNVALDFGGGRSVFLQGDVRGGDGLFGAGGKGGFRYQW